jgi:signal transduction histidine kinase
LLDSDASAIYELQIENGEMKIQTAQGVADVSRLAFPAVLEQSLQGAKPIAVCNVQPRPSINRSGLAQVVRGSALLGVPLVVDSELYGCLVLYYTQSRLFSDEEIDLAGSFGDQVALAIENARLRQRVEQAAIVAERHRLARELHDSVTQSLYSLTLLAEGWRRMAQSGELESMEDALVELGDIGRQALKEMRLMVHELRPPVLENEGLLGALHSRLNSVEKRAGIQMRLVADELPELPLHVEETLYRIAQEALNNALKHAAARSVKVHIAIEDERLIMSVEDDGCGFDQDQVQHSGGVGLHSMRERAARLGAVYELVSVPGHGTSICVQLALGDVSR